jgi:hypothetical protein
VSELLGLIVRPAVERAADFETNVFHVEGAMAADAGAILWVLAGIAVSAGNGFAVANRGEKLKSGHGFPLNMLEVESSE